MEWSQSNKEMTLLLPLAADIRAKEVRLGLASPPFPFVSLPPATLLRPLLLRSCSCSSVSPSPGLASSRRRTPRQRARLFPPQVRLDLTSQTVKVAVRGEAVLEGRLFLPIKPDDSFWELEAAPGGGKQLRAGLAKLRPNMQWDCLLMTEVDDSVTHRVYMDFSVGGSDAGRVVFGLCGKACPRTVENFRCLCTGEAGSVKVSKKRTVRLHYAGTAVHRVVPGFLVQGGDVTHSAGGTGGRSIYGPSFDDENFKLKHTGAGQLLMAHFGVANNNQSQWAVTLGHISEFERGHVFFGRVLEGMEVLQAIAMEGSAEGFTARPVVVEACGELDESGAPIEEVSRPADEPPTLSAEVAEAEAEDGLRLEPNEGAGGGQSLDALD